MTLAGKANLCSGKECQEEGVQSQGVGTSRKHFAVNNQGTRRFAINPV